MSAPLVADALVGRRLRISVRTRDADGQPVVPTDIEAHVGLRGSTPVEVEVAVEGDLATAEFDVTEAGMWAYLVTVREPVQAVAHGLVRVEDPVFSEVAP